MVNKEDNIKGVAQVTPLPKRSVYGHRVKENTMSEEKRSFSLFWKDLVVEAQDRLLELDNDVPTDILNSEVPMFEMRLKRKDVVDEDVIRAKVAELLGDDAPPDLVDQLVAQARDGNNSAAFAINKETGKVVQLTDEEVVALKKSGVPHQQVVMNDDCDCPECVERRAKHGSEVGVTEVGGNNLDPLNILNRQEPKSYDDWD
jgi:hypothetical protein